MRTLLIISGIILFAVAGCKDQPSNQQTAGSDKLSTQVDSSEFTTIQWMDIQKDFGKINEGEKLEVTFQFKNTGDKPLVINLIKPSCGCTLVEKPEKPTAPGETGEIKGSFDSNGKEGVQHKSIFVNANTKNGQNHNLEFTVEVVKKSQ